MNLSEQTRQLTENFISGLPQDDQATVQQAFEIILNSNSGDQALRQGNMAPDFQLPNAKGGETKLSDQLQQGPVVISFYRGGWCPYCNLEFKALSDSLPQIRDLGANLIGISPELPDYSMSTVEKHQLPFEVLSDVGNKISREYGIVMEMPAEMRPLYLQWGLDVPTVNGDDSWELPIPATYVIDQDGKITFAYINKNYTERCEPEHIIASLKALTEPA
jgi:peroxiredoxin